MHFPPLLVSLRLIYVGITFTLALTLLTNLFTSSRKVYPFQRIGGLAILMDCICSILPVIILLLTGDYSEHANAVVRTLNGFVVLFVFMAGISLINGGYPDFRRWVYYGLPYVLVFLFQLLFDRDSYLAGETSILVVSLIILTYMIHIVQPLSSQLKEMYSDLEGFGTGWYQKFALAVAVEVIAWYVVIDVVRADGWPDILYMLFMASMWIIFTHYLTRQKDTGVANAKAEAHASSSLTTAPSGLAELSSRLQTAMTDGKLYLDPKLDIATLAKVLESNTNYVYKAIHEELKTNFYEYVNSQRVAYSKNLLAETNDSPESIAASSGFSSLRTFYRVFKDIEGTTPAEWRKNNAH